MSETKTLTSVCWDCPTRCGSLVTVTDGKVTNIAPNPDHPWSKGVFCIKCIRGLKDWTYQDSRGLLCRISRIAEAA